jgi:hypothetical protein
MRISELLSVLLAEEGKGRVRGSERIPASPLPGSRNPERQNGTRLPPGAAVGSPLGFFRPFCLSSVEHASSPIATLQGAMLQIAH